MVGRVARGKKRVARVARVARSGCEPFVARVGVWAAAGDVATMLATKIRKKTSGPVELYR